MIPTKDRYDSLSLALSSLSKQNFNNFEVIIIDGASKDRTHTLISEYQNKLDIKLKVVKEGGLIRAMNEALKLSSGDIVIRTDDDVIFSKDWLKSIFETFSEDPNIGGVSGPTVIPEKYKNSRDLFFYENKMRNGSIFWRLLGYIYYEYFMEGQVFRVGYWCKSGCFTIGTNFSDSMQQSVQIITNLEACNWAVRRNLLVKIGGFDPIFTGVGEYHEPDAAFKIMNLGYRLVFNPRAMLNHCPSTEGFYKDRPSSYPRMINFIIFYMRHIKPNTLDKFFRFSCYLVFLNAFYTVQFFKKRQLSQLGAIPGTFVGIFKGLAERRY
jgi:glycosyltransferase involved in cell wall biosynthesis